MLNYNSKISQRKNLYVALCLAGIVFIILLSFIAMLQDSFRKKEHVELTQKYIIFESKVLRFIDSNIHLLKGFEAFIKLNFEGNEENLTQYLYYLLTNNSNYIKNIGILKGTKILWNYPKGNEDAIGVDLAMIAGQKEMILKVKNERTAAFQGPIDLVQGGTGFAVRLPIEKQDGSYWGQISIILDHCCPAKG